MREILLTSSALILALLVLRRLFRRTLSRRVQYALWGLVLLRLLTPVSLPAAEFSLLTAAKPPAVESRALYISPAQITLTAPEGPPLEEYSYREDPPIVIGPASEDNIYSYRNDRQVLHEVEYARQIVLADLYRAVWYAGCAVMTAWLVLSNLRFWQRLRKARTPYPVEGARRPVYLVEEGLSSPCLFGLFRPAVYLTPAALATPDSLRHVLAHEETHARHLDSLWSLLRGVCLAVYWFDPLVWWAALASRTDCELACDESVLRRLGEGERIPYGQTLLSLIPVRKAPANPLLSATTMTADKRRLKDRITRIAENRRTQGTALFAAVSLAALVCAVTFTGAKTPESFTDVDQAVAALAEEWKGSGGPESIENRLVVYTPEAPSKYFDLKEGELLRVYWGVYVSLSSNLQNPLGWLGSLYRVETLDDFIDGPDAVMEVLGSDGEFIYVFSRPQWAPELKAGQTQGTSLMNEVEARVREAVLSCDSVKRAGEQSRPDWEPILTIPLDSLEPYEPQAAEPLPFPYESCRMVGGLEDPEHVLGDYGLLFFEAGPPSSMGGEVYAGVQSLFRSSIPTPFWSFRPGAGGKYSASLFRNLMGHDGFCITYDANDGPRTLLHEYYYLNEEGWPVLLARAEEYGERVDLDGDGVDELLSMAFIKEQLWLRRGDQYYQIDMNALLKDHWPSPSLLYFERWDASSGLLPFRADAISFSSVRASEPRMHRMLRYDGESFRVYNDQRHFEGHVVEWLDMSPVVWDAALSAGEEAYAAANAPYYLDSQSPSRQTFYDDWRIVYLSPFYAQRADGREYLVCRADYELHTPEPREAPSLGEGAEDCWAAPGESIWLVFRDESENLSDLSFLCSFRHEGELTGEAFQRKLRELPSSKILDLGTAETPAVSAAALIQAALDEITKGETASITLLAAEGGGRYDVNPQAWVESGRFREFTDRYDWSYAEPPGDMPATSMLIIGQGGSLRFWPDRELVYLNRWAGGAWLRAEPTPGTPDMFYLLEFLYNIAEGRNLSIQSELEAMLTGGSVTLTRTSPEGVETRTADPGQLGGMEAFTGDYDWTLCPDTYSRSPITLELASEDGWRSFTFTPDNTLVKFRRGEDVFWFRVQPKETASSIYEFVVPFLERKGTEKSFRAL